MMMQKCVIPALVGIIPVLLFALTDSTVQEQPPYDIVMFYNTSQPIITYYTTGGKDMCKDDIKINITNQDIYLLRGFKSWWMPPTLLYGLFCGNTSYKPSTCNSMKLTSTNDTSFPPRNGTRWNSQETLFFATNDFVCGVFRVDLFSNGGRTGIYEVRVRNAYKMDEIAQQCLNYTSVHFSGENFTDCKKFK
ncbi:uncharacterized protein LOC119464718 [Dermacentor silvarum]|uniref:uncharacterized protein LOC119464718 n=1 Tax=Dermacentor silvarum TaxID=543639 RepID=UPI002100F676|nr:uncharacterized protein LOC119464718 [Dermacentor silvarum]